VNSHVHLYARPERDSRVIINICRAENFLRKKKGYREIIIVHFMPKIFSRDSCGFLDGSRKLNILLCCDISVGKIVVNIYIGGSYVNLWNIMAFHVALRL